MKRRALFQPQTHSSGSKAWIWGHRRHEARCVSGPLQPGQPRRWPGHAPAHTPLRPPRSSNEWRGVAAGAGGRTGPAAGNYPGRRRWTVWATEVLHVEGQIPVLGQHREGQELPPPPASVCLSVSLFVSPGSLSPPWARGTCPDCRERPAPSGPGLRGSRPSIAGLGASPRCGQGPEPRLTVPGRSRCAEAANKRGQSVTMASRYWVGHRRMVRVGRGKETMEGSRRCGWLHMQGCRKLDTKEDTGILLARSPGSPDTV